jgi:hypothetical protein
MVQTGTLGRFRSERPVRGAFDLLGGLVIPDSLFIRHLWRLQKSFIRQGAEVFVIDIAELPLAFPLLLL